MPPGSHTDVHAERQFVRRNHADVYSSGNSTVDAIKIVNLALLITLTMKTAFLTALSVFLLNASTAYSQYFSWGGNIMPEVKDMGIDGQGNVIQAGVYDAAGMDADPGTGVVPLDYSGGNDVFIQKLDSDGNLLWVKSIGTISEEYVESIAVDAAGNSYIAGGFGAPMDIDPGSGVFTLPYIGQHFLLKLDPDGNFVWAKESEVYFRAITVDDAGLLYLAGAIFGTVDLDPGTGSLMESAPDGACAIIKCDNQGNAQWAKVIGPGFITGYSIDTDADGNVYTAGMYNGNSPIDFDPSAGVYTFPVNTTTTDLFIQKLSANGDFLWAKSVNGDTNYLFLYAMMCDPAGNVYSAGILSDEAVDADPGPGVFMVGGGTNATLTFVQKLDTNGDFMWAHSIDIPSQGISEQVFDMDLDAAGNIYLAGIIGGTDIDLDPGTGEYMIDATYSQAIIRKISPAGAFISALQFDANEVSGVNLGSDNAIYANGRFIGDGDLDPGPGAFPIVTSSGPVSFDIESYAVKFTQDLCSDMRLIVDSVSNLTCADPEGYASGHGFGGAEPYSYLWATTPSTADSTAVFGHTGFFTFIITDAINCTLSADVLIGGSDLNEFDLDVNLAAAGFRPGSVEAVSLDAFNHGCVPASGELRLILDTSVAYAGYYNIEPTNLLGDTIVWSFEDLADDSLHLVPVIYVQTDTTLQEGDQLCFKVIITPQAGDANVLNNEKTYCFTAVNSYDPNIKSAYPQGSCPPAYVLKEETLTYTVQFQNTGTAEAINIYVLDSLDMNLDAQSLRIAGSSHPVITELYDGHYVKFRFNNIHLADGTTDEPASHGYVIFEIKPLAGITEGAVVENTAHIFFDYNAPVSTNTVSRTLVEEIPQSYMNTDVATICAACSYEWYGTSYTTPGTYTHIEESTDGCSVFDTLVLQHTLGVNELTAGSFTLYPNPAAESFTIDLGTEMQNVTVVLMDMKGSMLHETVYGQARFIKESLEGQEQGMYLVRIFAGDRSGVMRVVKRDF